MYVNTALKIETVEKDEFIWNLVDEIRLKNIDSIDKNDSLMYITI